MNPGEIIYEGTGFFVEADEGAFTLISCDYPMPEVDKLRNVGKVHITVRIVRNGGSAPIAPEGLERG